MERLSPIESEVIRSLLVKQYGSDSPFLKQLETAHFDVRHPTGVGFYGDLLLASNAAPVDSINAEPSEAYRTSLNPPCDLVGFTLFIRDGYLSSFEGYTFGDVEWPKDLMETWLVLDLA